MLGIIFIDCLEWKRIINNNYYTGLLELLKVRKKFSQVGQVSQEKEMRSLDIFLRVKNLIWIELGFRGKHENIESLVFLP